MERLLLFCKMFTTWEACEIQGTRKWAPGRRGHSTVKAKGTQGARLQVKGSSREDSGAGVQEIREWGPFKKPF